MDWKTGANERHVERPRNLITFAAANQKIRLEGRASSAISAKSKRSLPRFGGREGAASRSAF